MIDFNNVYFHGLVNKKEKILARDKINKSEFIRLLLACKYGLLANNMMSQVLPEYYNPDNGHAHNGVEYISLTHKYKEWNRANELLPHYISHVSTHPSLIIDRRIEETDNFKIDSDKESQAFLTVKPDFFVGIGIPSIYLGINNKDLLRAIKDILEFSQLSIPVFNVDSEEVLINIARK